MKQNKIKNIIVKGLLTTIGSLLVAISVNLIFEPAGMVTGGISGAAIAVKQLTKGLYRDGIPVWFTNVILNIPLFFIAYKIMGKEFIKRVLCAAVLFNIFLAVIPTIDYADEDYFLAAIFGGITGGAGMGIIFRLSTSIGGTDLLGTVIHEKIGYISIARILMILDAAIVTFGAFTFGAVKACYAILAVYVSARVTDTIVEGANFAKMVYIVSDKDRDIAQNIMQKAHRGVTGLDGKGMYSKIYKNLLLCVVNRKEITKLLEIIAEIDNNAFIIVTDVREVRGEGFIENVKKS